MRDELRCAVCLLSDSNSRPHACSRRPACFAPRVLQPGECAARPVWRYRWPDFLQRLTNTTDLVINAGHHWSLARATPDYIERLFAAAAAATHAEPRVGRGAWCACQSARGLATALTSHATTIAMRCAATPVAAPQMDSGGVLSR